jgi:glycosyltransferase involved in cell wall biosynthesis
MTERFKNVTILLPAIDETYSLRETVDVIFDTCGKEDIAEIIILLCNKTMDDTKNVAEDLVSKYQKEGNSIYIHYQTLPFVGGAIREGFNLAKGSHVILMSSDLETDPCCVSRLIEKSKQNPDYIITASRWRKGGGFKGYSKIKLICNLIFERIMAMLFLVNLTDVTYAFRLFPTELMKSIAWEELKHPFFLETALKPIRLGIKFIEIPAHWVARTEGVSQNTFFQNFNYFKTAWHIRFMPKNKILKANNGEGGTSRE